MTRGTGDAAFLTLHEAFADRVYTYCLRLCRSPEDAADALQETFANLLVRLEDEDAAPIAHPRAYLFAAARNACLKRLDEQRRFAVVGDLPELPSRDGDLADGEVEVLTEELRADVRAVEAHLPERQREILALREVEGMSYADIGALMGLTPNAAAQLAWRARMGMKGLLRRRALRGIAPATIECEHALTLLELREDGPLSDGDATWLDEHLSECDRCEANRAAMVAVGTTYRAVLPLVPAPFLAHAALAKAHAGAAAAAAGAGPGAAGGGAAAGGGTSTTTVAGGLAAVGVVLAGLLVATGAFTGKATETAPARGAATPPPAARAQAPGPAPASA